VNELFLSQHYLKFNDRRKHHGWNSDDKSLVLAQRSNFVTFAFSVHGLALGADGPVNINGWNCEKSRVNNAREACRLYAHCPLTNSHAALLQQLIRDYLRHDHLMARIRTILALLALGIDKSIKQEDSQRVVKRITYGLS